MRGSGFGEGAFYRAVSLASGKEIGRLCLKMRVFRIFADGLGGVWVPLCGLSPKAAKIMPGEGVVALDPIEIHRFAPKLTFGKQADSSRETRKTFLVNVSRPAQSVRWSSLSAHRSALGGSVNPLRV